jgi:hypothetical protein
VLAAAMEQLADEQEGHKTRYWSGDGGGAPSR